MELTEENRQKIIQAGKIASQVKDYARSIIKPSTSLLEIAEKIEAKIVELGGKPAFPVNLSINNIAAHFTPAYNDKEVARGLLKIDIGVHVDGWVADTAFSLDLEGSEENKKLIQASEEALEKALELINENSKSTLSEVGSVIEKTIESHGFSPVINLSGHSIGHYNLHSGITVPNFNNNASIRFEDGLYAVEPFATTGNGKVHDGKLSGIYYLISEKNPRGSQARKVLAFIKKGYNSLPFCSRWISKKLGLSSLFALKELEANGNLHHFAQLVESSGSGKGEIKVSQAEQTILIQDGKVTVTTL